MLDAKTVLAKLAAVQGHLSIDAGIASLPDGTTLDLRPAKPRFTAEEGPRVVKPMNAEQGLYINVLSHDGHVSNQEILEFCRPLAMQHGYNPDGRGMVGIATIYGPVARTYAIWFYDLIKAKA
ncbi:hypothetical protein F6X40_27710 [Paraburkholderia sp. UCT31]|uniref:hypothetical protein n=1 Tax=Paraburkholderia sp. UCT31 TaxID=2615209 RepID=UPI0016562C54|nr:hypothetical protein [Paraburkholderia sp. UCT31]MBC8740426.1 hypothetical protein [Paraburkholderia sp. UCT31]